MSSEPVDDYTFGSDDEDDAEVLGEIITPDVQAGLMAPRSRTRAWTEVYQTQPPALRRDASERPPMTLWVEFANPFDSYRDSYTSIDEALLFYAGSHSTRIEDLIEAVLAKKSELLISLNGARSPFLSALELTTHMLYALVDPYDWYTAKKRMAELGIALRHFLLSLTLVAVVMMYHPLQHLFLRLADDGTIYVEARAVQAVYAIHPTGVFNRETAGMPTVPWNPRTSALFTSFTTQQVYRMMQIAKQAKPAGFAAMVDNREAVLVLTPMNRLEALVRRGEVDRHKLYQLVGLASMGFVLEAGLMCFLVAQLGHTSRLYSGLKILYTDPPTVSYHLHRTVYRIAPYEL